MSGFLSKSKQRLEHTSKLNVGEFKQLQALIGQEKNLLNSHVRVANDLRKASHSLDEWAQSEGPDLADTLGKVAKLLANDLAKAEEEYAEHLSNFRMYFKQLRTREEKFSQLKKNKETLQGKIDSAEKKLAKMSPEHKDLATWTQKLSELRHEMIGMDNSVINEEAAIGDYRRQTARSATAHQLAALCQLGEKMTIIGELGKLLTYEIRLDKTEPGRDRVMYNGYDRTLQIYGEAQTCLHKVVFDASNTEPAYTSLPVPSHGDFDHSYEYDQESQRESQDAELQSRTSKRQSLSSRDPSLGTATSPLQQTSYPSQAQYLSPDMSASANRNAVPSFQPLQTPVQTENDFADAVNATWQERNTRTANEAQPYEQTHPLPTVPMYPAYTEPPQQSTPTVYQNAPAGGQEVAGGAYEEAPVQGDPYGGAEYSREEDDEPEYVDESQYATQNVEPSQEREGITTIDEETRSALQETELSTERGVGGFTNPSQTSSDRVQRHQLHDRPVPRDPDTDYGVQAAQQEASAITNPTLQEAAPNHEAYEDNTQGLDQHDNSTRTFEPTGDDLYGTGLYGNTAEGTVVPEDHTSSATAHPEPNGTPALNEADSPTALAASTPAYTEPPAIVYAAPTSPQNVTLPASPPVPQADSNFHSRQASNRPAPSPDLSAASALAAAAAASIRPRQNTQGSSKSVSKPQNIATTTPAHLSYTTVATSNKSPISPVLPSPTRREKTPPAKQHSYRSEAKHRPETNEGLGRSSIAYLNDTPVLEPPMRAPPPTNLGMPLPSSSPYFNPYANLRSSSGGPGDHALSMSGGLSTASGGRPKGARTSNLDTTLGSKHGFELRTVQQPHERPLLQQQPSANTNASAVRDKDYSYAIRTGDDGGGRRLAAGAFRRANPSSSSIPSFRSGEDSSSPAQRLRDEWRSSVLPSPAAEFVTPAQTPGELPMDTPRGSNSGGGGGYMDVGESMYGERAASRAPLSHRTSAVDAPMDVMPNDDQSQSDLHHIAEGGGEGEGEGEQQESVLPLNVRKKSPQAGQTEFPQQETAAGEGFGGGNFVTKLE